MAKPAPWDKMTRHQKDEWVEKLVPHLEILEEIGLDPKHDRFWSTQKCMPAAVVAGRTMCDRDEVQEWIDSHDGMDGIKKMILESKRKYYRARGEAIPKTCWHDSEPAPEKKPED